MNIYRAKWNLIKVLTVAVVLVVGGSSVTDGSPRVMSYSKNLKVASKWACKEPQPRLIYVGKFIKFIYITYSIYIYESSYCRV